MSDLYDALTGLCWILAAAALGVAVVVLMTL